MKRAWMIFGFLAVAAGAMAQMGPMAGMAPMDETFLQAMAAGMKTMDHDMNAAPMDGDVDHDFAAMMMPHHQGAIDMAKAELNYGSDPVMRRLAQEILVEQQSEIQLMQLWLQKKQNHHHPKDPL